MVPKILGLASLALFALAVYRYYSVEGRRGSIMSRYSGGGLRQAQIIGFRMGLYRALSFLMPVVVMAFVSTP